MERDILNNLLTLVEVIRSDFVRLDDDFQYQDTGTLTINLQFVYLQISNIMTPVYSLHLGDPQPMLPPLVLGCPFST